MNDELAQLRQKLTELADLHRRGGIETEAYARQKQALETRMVAIVMDVTPQKAAVSQAPKVALMAAASGLLVAAVLGATFWFGKPAPSNLAADDSRPASPAGKATIGRQEGQNSGGHSVASEQIGLMIERLAARLQDQPDDGNGWAMLARSYAVTGRYAEAVPAFRKAAALKQDDPVLLADFADALAMTRDGAFDIEALALVEQALKLDPNNAKALLLAGTAAFARNDRVSAIRYWETVARVAPPDSPFALRARDGIAKARDQ